MQRGLGTSCNRTGTEHVAAPAPTAGVMSCPPATLSPHHHFSCSALFWGGGGWQRQGVGESLCFAVAVATVVSLAAGARFLQPAGV